MSSTIDIHIKYTGRREKRRLRVGFPPHHPASYRVARESHRSFVPLLKASSPPSQPLPRSCRFVVGGSPFPVSINPCVLLHSRVEYNRLLAKATAVVKGLDKGRPEVESCQVRSAGSSS